MLAELEAAQERGEDVSATVLICGGSGKGEMQRTGMVVRRVLDVSGGTLLEKDGVSGDMELALVKEKLTMVHREFSVKAAPAWKEVAMKIQERDAVNEILNEDDAVSLCSMFAGSQVLGSIRGRSARCWGIAICNGCPWRLRSSEVWCRIAARC